MQNQIQAGASPPKYQVLTGYGLKLIGIVLMVLDHLYEMLYPFGVPIGLRMAGRACMPIFLFMAAEGFHYTRNRKRYMMRLLIGFWLMGIGNMLLSRFMPLDDIVLINNVFGTMFLSTFYMWLIETIKDGVKQKKPVMIVLSIGGMLLPIASFFLITQAVAASVSVGRILMILLPSILTTEGGFAAVVLSVLFYLLQRFGRLVQMLPLALVSILSALSGGFQWMMIFSAIPLLLYNGKPGRKSKWFFYIFYPTHIYILYVVSYLLH